MIMFHNEKLSKMLKKRKPICKSKELFIAKFSVLMKLLKKYTSKYISHIFYFRK